MTTAAITTPGSNRMTFADLRATATKLGSERGKGKDSWTKFLRTVTEAGYLGTVDLTRDKHGAGMDDAHQLTEDWVKGQTGAVIYDHKTDNSRKAASCVRAVVKLGGYTKGGQGEPIATLDNLLDMRATAKKNPQTAKNLDDPSNTVLRYAREQVKRDTLIDEEELKTFLYKPTGALRTAEEEIAALRKGLYNLINGKTAHGTVQDASSKVKDAAKALDERLTEIAKAKAPAPGAVALQGKKVA